MSELKTPQEDANLEVLERILMCQNEASHRSGLSNYELALKEIKGGEKKSHWIWYVFPCPKGVRTTGRPELEIPNLSTAQEYLKNSDLRARLVEITSEAVKHIRLESPESPFLQLNFIFGPTDAGKFNETVTMFALTAFKNGDSEALTVFTNALTKTNDGKLEMKTLKKLKKMNPKMFDEVEIVADLTK